MQSEKEAEPPEPGGCDVGMLMWVPALCGLEKAEPNGFQVRRANLHMKPGERLL